MGRGKNWTDEEIEFLKENVGNYTTEGIAKILGRTTHAVTNKRKRLKLGCFKNNTDLINTRDVAEMLGINISNVYEFIYNKKLKCRKKGKRYYFKLEDVQELQKNYKPRRCGWTSEEVSRLQMYLKKGCTYNEIAKMLNMTYGQVKNKIKENYYRQREISLGYKTGRWSKQEVRQLKQLLAEGKTRREICDIMKRTIASIRKKIHILKRGN